MIGRTYFPRPAIDRWYRNIFSHDGFPRISNNLMACFSATFAGRMGLATKCTLRTSVVHEGSDWTRANEPTVISSLPLHRLSSTRCHGYAKGDSPCKGVRTSGCLVVTGDWETSLFKLSSATGKIFYYALVWRMTISRESNGSRLLFDSVKMKSVNEN